LLPETNRFPRTTRPVTFLVSGTRGDVQPLVALGAGLLRAGYPVRMVTHPPFAALVASQGLEFVPLDGNPNELLQHPEHAAALATGSGLLRGAIATLRYLRAAQPVFRRMLKSAWQGCRSAGTLIVTLPTTWGCQIAEALDVACFCALMQPLGANDSFPSPLLPVAPKLGPTANRLTHHLTTRALWAPWQRQIDNWRRHQLGLPSLRTHDPFAQFARQGVPIVYGISPSVVPWPAAWPAQYHLTGYWLLDHPAWQPPGDLCAFLADGPPPIFIGFGSIASSQTQDMLERVLAAIERAGRRAVLVWRMLPSALRSLPPGVFMAADVPHDWLFARVAAAVHHGGAGVTAAALRAGLPTVAVPFAADQFFWGRRVAALGCGPPPLPLARLTAAALASAIDSICENSKMRTSAQALSARINAEDGIARAVEIITAIADG
jgi:sterol 3beta-glucosyltransferase